MTLPRTTAAWVALLLQTVSALLAGASCLALAVTTTASPAIARSHRVADLVWASLAALPVGLTAALAALVAVASLRTNAVLRTLGTTVGVAALMLSPLDVLGAAWGLLLASGHDDKWVCVYAAGGSAVASVLLMASGLALHRAASKGTSAP